MNDQVVMDRLAFALEYPAENYHRGVAALGEVMAEQHENDMAMIRAFLEGVAERSETELEELYTRTFDINPTCSLEVGWQVFGETYDRGGFLVKINQSLQDHGVPPNKELGDHLPQMLRLFARMTPSKARDLVVAFLSPAIDKMLTGFSGEENPFFHLLTATNTLLKSHAADIDARKCHA